MGILEMLEFQYAVTRFIADYVAPGASDYFVY
jgi:hypothetical protein